MRISFKRLVKEKYSKLERGKNKEMASPVRIIWVESPRKDYLENVTVHSLFTADQRFQT